MQFEYDPERLIEEVKKRPGIWDFESVDYRVKHVRQALWSEIVRELNSNTAQASKCELRELELQLQKKWKSIRDCYQKFIGKTTKNRRPYIYSKQLAFLSNPQKRPADNNPSSDSEEEKNKNKWVFKKISRIIKNDDDDEPEHLQVRQIEDSEEETAAASNTSRDHFSNSFAFANVDSVQNNDENDPDKLFLLSLLPHLKKVPDENRLNVKMEMMAVLQNAQYARDTKHIL